MDLLLTILRWIFSPLIGLIAKFFFKPKQEISLKEANDAIAQKNKEVNAMSAADRTDDAVIDSLRKHQLPDA